jgi:hypothetical protein
MRLDGSGSVQPDRTIENGGIAASVFVLAVGTGAMAAGGIGKCPSSFSTVLQNAPVRRRVEKP